MTIECISILPYNLHLFIFQNQIKPNIEKKNDVWIMSLTSTYNLSSITKTLQEFIGRIRTHKNNICNKWIQCNFKISSWAHYFERMRNFIHLWVYVDVRILC